MALAGRQKYEDGTMIAHSDYGTQYTSYEYTNRLVEAGIAPSRERTGTALDNAMAESVISTIKTELIKRHVCLADMATTGTCPCRLHRLVQRSPPASRFKGRTPLDCDA